MRKVTWSTLIGVVTWVVFSGCSSDKSVPLGKRGETCESRADCESGLVCVKGTCGVGNFNLVPTGKSCALIECAAAEDCCPTPPTTCPQLKTTCDAGNQTACDLYQSQCVCNPAKYACSEDRCSQACTETDAGSTGCSSPTPVCAGGKCVQCGKDTDCTSGSACVNNRCQTKCKNDNDCTGRLEKCVEGECINAGCSTDGQCIADRNNRLAVCKDTKCVVPCQSDLECPFSITASQQGSSVIEACIGGQCVDVGCDSDDQCRILLPPARGSRQRSVCRANAL